MKHGKAYGGANPELIEGDIFRMVVKYPDTAAYADRKATAQVTEQVAAHDGVHDGVHDLQLTDVMKKILNRLKQPASTPELLETLEYPRRTRNYSASMKSLLDAGLISMTRPHAPRSKNQKYRLTAKGRSILARQAEES